MKLTRLTSCALALLLLVAPAAGQAAEAGVDQALQVFVIKVKTLRLIKRRDPAWIAVSRHIGFRSFIPIHPEPLQAFQDAQNRLVSAVAKLVGVLNPEQEMAAKPASQRPIEKGGAGAADVEGAGGRRGEAGGHAGTHQRVG